MKERVKQSSLSLLTFKAMVTRNALLSLLLQRIIFVTNNLSFEKLPFNWKDFAHKHKNTSGSLAYSEWLTAGDTEIILYRCRIFINRDILTDCFIQNTPRSLRIEFKDHKSFIWLIFLTSLSALPFACCQRFNEKFVEALITPIILVIRGLSLQ